LKFQKGSIRRSLHYSILDGLFTAMMMGVSDFYLIPYCLALGATSAQIGVLATAPMLVATILQIRSASLTQSLGSRMQLIRPVVLLHTLSWIPILAVPFVMKGDWKPYAPWAMLAAMTVFAATGAFAIPAWQSLMSDYIPTRRRGVYFGWRNRLQGFLTVLVSVTAGLVLHAFGKGSLKGFTLIFAFAMMCRFYAWICLSRMVEPFRRASHDEYFGFVDFLRGLRTSRLARFVVFAAMITFSANLSGALLAPFLLRDLAFDYATFMMLVSAASLSGFLFQWYWGASADVDGNVRTIKRAAWGIALTPLLWMVSRNPVWLVFVQLFAGCVWGGFALLMVNFTLEASSPERKIRSLSYLNVMNSFSAFAGATIGGLLIQKLPKLFGYSYLTLFLLSCFLRIAIMLFVSPKIRDVRVPARS